MCMKQDRSKFSSFSWQGAVAANVLLLLAPMSPAAAQSQKGNAVSSPITPYLNARYRLEVVDQDGSDRSAVASTLRLRAGVRTAAWNGLSALVEGEAILRLGPKHYNDTVNGVTDRPIVADPSDILLNQAYLKWQPSKNLETIIGRQTVNLDNQRWIGSVDWRQNDQTLDAIRIGVTPATGTRLEYAHNCKAANFRYFQFPGFGKS